MQKSGSVSVVAFSIDTSSSRLINACFISSQVLPLSSTTKYIHSTSSSHYCDSESLGSVGIPVKNKDSLLWLIASFPERLHFLRNIRMCGEAHKGTLLIIITVAQPLVVLGHVTEGLCDKWKITTLK